MTSIYYVWTSLETGEIRETKSWPEVNDWVKNEGGTFEKKEQVVKDYESEGYCQPGAASCQRWKNYKY